MNTDLVYTTHKLPADQEQVCTILPFPKLSRFKTENCDLHSVSVVIPIFNEADNLAEMATQTYSALLGTGRDFEVIFVDDGSTDQSSQIIAELIDSHRWLRSIRLTHNLGQTAAMDAGIQASTGDYVVTLDGDLQNDPADIPAMLRRLDDGYDIVLGWRKNRHDNWLRKQASKTANWLVRRVTGTAANDMGCTLKAMNRSIAGRLELCGDMHRFIPVLADHLGAKSFEIKVNHRPRTQGESKYGFERIPRVLQDLVTLAALKHRANPMRFFGGWSLTFFAACLGLAIASVACVLMGWSLLVAGGLALFAMVMAVGSIQLIGVGVLAEFSLRNSSISRTLQASRVQSQQGLSLDRRRVATEEETPPKDKAFASFSA
jgi:hypothetical protein